MRLPTYQELSREQLQINALPPNDSFLVGGPPGTGKTVMALYRARMLNQRGERVHLLMYSNLLSQYTLAAGEALGIGGTISTFHKWFGGFYKGCFNRYAPQVAPYEFDWQQIFDQFARKPPAPQKLGHLIIDEGQDLPPRFYGIARMISRNMTIFADENQRLRETSSTFKEIKSHALIKNDVYFLTKNYRNTRPIAELAASFHVDAVTGIADLPDRKGNRPAMLALPNLTAAVDFVVRNERNNPTSQIGVLVPTLNLVRKFRNRLEGKVLRVPQFYSSDKDDGDEAVDFDRPGVIIVTYESAKGLEFDTVVMPELQASHARADDPNTKMRFYVLTSRARDDLFVAYSGVGRPDLAALFTEDLIEWRS